MLTVWEKGFKVKAILYLSPRNLEVSSKIRHKWSRAGDLLSVLTSVSDEPRRGIIAIYQPIHHTADSVDTPCTIHRQTGQTAVVDGWYRNRSKSLVLINVFHVLTRAAVHICSILYLLYCIINNFLVAHTCHESLHIGTSSNEDTAVFEQSHRHAISRLTSDKRHSHTHGRHVHHATCAHDPRRTLQ